MPGNRVLAIDGGGPVCGPGPVDPNESAVWSDGAWTASGRLNLGRYDFQMQPLPGGGAIVAGGSNDDGVSFSSTKVWDPAKNTWSQAPGLMHTARTGPGSAALKDGRVIVFGGNYENGNKFRSLVTAEIFDSKTGRWTLTGSLHHAMSDAQAVTLSDGRVLAVEGPVSSGATTRRAEVWAPTTGKWTVAGAYPTNEYSNLVALTDGSAVAVAADAIYGFDPVGLTWSPLAMFDRPVGGRIVALLPDGRVLVAGGLPLDVRGPDAMEAFDGATPSPANTDARIFDPSTGTLTTTAPLPSPRAYADPVVLSDGSVLVVGGISHRTIPGGTPSCPSLEPTSVRYVPGS